MGSVELWVYALGDDNTVNLVNSMLGTKIEGFWHTSLVVFDREYYFMGGIQKSIPGTTPFGTPSRKIDFGGTEMTQEQLNHFLSSVNDQFTEETYHIIRNNCNHFSNVLMKQLVDKEIPSYIMEVARMFENTPFESLLAGINPGMK